MGATVSGVANVIRNLEKAADQIRKNCRAAADEIAVLLTDYAKSNHPWQNQTGNTQQTTKAGVAEATDKIIRVVLTTGTDYSQFLELCRSGQYAWLWPTMLACEGQIKDILTRRLGEKAGSSFGFAMSRSEQ